MTAALILWCNGFRTGLHYQDVKDSFVQIKATIAGVEENYDGEGGTTYTLHIKYSHNGKNYSQTTSGDSKSRVGDTVKIDINPNNPLEIAHEMRSSYKTGLAVGSIFLGLAFLVSKMKIRKGWCETYGINRETIHQDVLVKMKHELNGIGFLVVAIGAMVGWMTTFEDAVLIIEMVVTAFFGYLLLKNHIVNVRLIKEERYSIRTDQLITKWIEEESDAPDTYHLQYKTLMAGSYKISVKKKVYDRAVIGDEILSVFLEQKKEPYMVIHLHDRVAQ